MRIEWSPTARASTRRYLSDQAGVRAIAVAVGALAVDPSPLDAFIRGDYRRLKVGAYRIMYVVDDGIITIERVDRIS